MNPEQFQQALANKGITLSAKQMQQFADYYQLLVKTNEHVNLTRITDENEVYLKHFYDSITGAFAEPRLTAEELTLCDIGAGAGFPSLPLKIAFPQLKVTIVDSLNKRIAFLDELVAKLGLTDVTLIHDRAETFSAKKSSSREQFDIVTARAVARLSVLSELCLPAVKVGGEFIAYKASAASEELQKGGTAIKQLGGQVQKIVPLTLPVTDEERNIIVIDKVKSTPNKYPRRPGLPSKKPIQ
ncbi:16S rRNA (guanine(527)-N(7))-methyltransferase RsmG [Limosilactobacillus sp. RRLNB_1_1]|uniref:Ribosomal RNA small subunit methyltransferase G n=1 Tax=Limosilactobacillus albertensis TaxID=2759752 RepID=A0A7W3TSH3_9LACO|nr:16S rRNA (guanine(527)-N(7))-methyltransferase RsmG [Limosilactobacillus albertensis]MBB1070100.1 16S rRNA (guanine(527)-N(7))-methyltransferase RsmG [Limosilactobacillus albertensis]MCD7117753.1 16S rRNA (guanine(527)-N(7))-methyltransferase RsmG [Limosilactobacillus albertensis]MCD7128300.1 16S rRNA (guanine(527)-N(7))-methyltransferase RsmG [Limosilactobacillus albertensis]